MTWSTPWQYFLLFIYILCYAFHMHRAAETTFQINQNDQMEYWAWWYKPAVPAFKRLR